MRLQEKEMRERDQMENRGKQAEAEEANSFLCLIMFHALIFDVIFIFSSRTPSSPFFFFFLLSEVEAKVNNNCGLKISIDFHYLKSGKLVGELKTYSFT